MDRNFDTMLAEFRRGAARDYIGLWEVIKDIKRNIQPEPGNLKSVTLEFVATMMSSGFVAGRSRGRKFEQWRDQRIEKVIERIDREWSALGREPNIGHIVSFDLPNSS